MSRRSDDYDIVVVGAGHNGLTCACYLANAGLKVLILERRGVVGGAAVTEEFHPGFRNSLASYTVSLLNPKVIRDLNLARHGLEILPRATANFLPLPDGDGFLAGADTESLRSEIARFSEHDAEALPAYLAHIESLADIVRDQLFVTPPNVGDGLKTLVQGGRLARRLSRLPLTRQQHLLDVMTLSAAEFLNRWFEHDVVKAFFGFDSIVGNFASPYSAGSAYVLLHHVFGEVNGIRGAWGHAVGGMGAITAAMAAEAKRLGVDILTDSPVERIVVRDGEVRGVRLPDGRVFPTRRVAANVNPKLLCLSLLPPDALPSEFRERMQAYRCASGSFRMNVALDELPDFTARPGTELAAHHRSGIIIAPSLDYMDQAWRDAERQGCSTAPVVEMLIPSTVDATLAPEGKHVASLFCQYVAPEWPDERDWDDVRDDVADHMIATVTRYAPNFAESVIARRALSPKDLERELGLIGGDIFHGALSLNQLFSARPVLGAADYRLPVRGLYLCGSGAHPGGGVTGVPGHNAAREILRDQRRRRRSR